MASNQKVALQQRQQIPPHQRATEQEALRGEIEAVAALGVACIVIYVSIKLGARTVQGLLDQSPSGLSEKIQLAVEAVPGVAGCHQVRVRTSGSRLFIDAHINVDPDQSLQKAHELTEQVERAISAITRNADITIHPEPVDALPPAAVPEEQGKNQDLL